MAGRKTVQPWERQPGETEKAFAAFEVYLNMGAERSLVKASKAHGKCESVMYTWSHKHHWFDRARAYDNMLKGIELAETKKQVRKMQQRQIKAAMLLQEKALEALEMIDLNKVQARDILSYIIDGAKLEKETRQSYLDDGQDKKGSNASLADEILDAYERRREQLDDGEVSDGT